MFTYILCYAYRATTPIITPVLVAIPSPSSIHHSTWRGSGLNSSWRGLLPTQWLANWKINIKANVGAYVNWWNLQEIQVWHIYRSWKSNIYQDVCRKFANIQNVCGNSVDKTTATDLSDNFIAYCSNRADYIYAFFQLSSARSRSWNSSWNSVIKITVKFAYKTESYSTISWSWSSIEVSQSIRLRIYGNFPTNKRNNVEFNCLVKLNCDFNAKFYSKFYLSLKFHCRFETILAEFRYIQGYWIEVVRKLKGLQINFNFNVFFESKTVFKRVWNCTFCIKVSLGTNVCNWLCLNFNINRNRSSHDWSLVDALWVFWKINFLFNFKIPIPFKLNTYFCFHINRRWCHFDFDRGIRI